MQQRTDVGGHDKLIERIFRGTSDANIAFDELRRLLSHLGFEERTRGSHHVYRKSKAKPYRVRQVRDLILIHRLAGDE